MIYSHVKYMVKNVFDQVHDKPRYRRQHSAFATADVKMKANVCGEAMNFICGHVWKCDIRFQISSGKYKILYSTGAL